MSIAEFHSRVVAHLGGAARDEIWDLFSRLILSEISRLEIPCELWVDGSFITRCPEPNDIDGSLMVRSDALEILTEDAVNYLKKFDDSERSFHEKLDIFLCTMYPPDHPLCDDWQDPEGWAREWSKERNSDWLKGFVVIPFR